LGRMAMERMLAGLSTRRYRVGLEPVGTRTEQTATATSKSAVSRRFVEATETALAELLAADLFHLDLVALMVDGVHFGEHTCVVALGIDIEGTKHPLSLVEGSTENATLVTELIVGLRERGLDVTRPILAVLDGSKALRRAVLDVFDHPVIQRCQLHKICECVVAVLLGGGPPGSVPVTLRDSGLIWPLRRVLSLTCPWWLPVPAWPTSWPDLEACPPEGVTPHRFRSLSARGRDPSQICRCGDRTQAGADG